MMMDARSKAVEVMLDALLSCDLQGNYGSLPARGDAADIISHMAAAGWVMVRDVAAIDGAGSLLVADNDRMRMGMVAARASGWNACRLAMLADPAPER